MQHLLTCLVFTSLCLAMPNDAACGEDSIYALDRMNHHPYRYVPAYGHASQNPGSPKWFVPGYGYRIPGFGYSASMVNAPNYYHYEVPTPPVAMFSDQSYWTLGRAPWHLPGAPSSDRLLRSGTRW